MGMCHTVRTEEVIVGVERSVEEAPNHYIRHRAQDLDMCPSAWFVGFLIIR